MISNKDLNYNIKNYYDFLEEKVDLSKIYNSIISMDDIYLFFLNLETMDVYCSENFLNCFDFHKHQNHNAIQSIKSIIHSDDYRKLVSSANSLIKKEQEYLSLNIRLKDISSEFSWYNIRMSLVGKDKDNEVLFAYIRLAYVKNNMDYLTELPNRNYIEDNIRNAINKYPDREFAILNLDIDDFRKVNQYYDRTFGDLALWKISHSIQRVLDTENLQLCRIDGDTFAIQINTNSEEEVKRIYDRLVDEGVKSIKIEKKKFNFTLSGGCAMYPKDGKTYEVLQNYAEYSLNNAKNSGKDTLKFFNEELYYLNYRYCRLSDIIEDAIDNDFEGFDIVFQPHITTFKEELVGAEALSRFHCDEYGSVSPVEFISIIERLGRIKEFGKWVVTKSIKTCKIFQKYIPDFHINVNVSFNQLEDNDFINYLEREIRENDFNPEDLVLEITENTIMDNTEVLIEKFKEISSLGVKVAIDDFGTGYSSLGILKEVRFDVLKIDKVFVKDITKDDFYILFLQMLSKLCKKLNVISCLEGVETKEEYDIIKRDSSIDIIQGYYFGKPRNYRDFINYISLKKC